MSDVSIRVMGSQTLSFGLLIDYPISSQLLCTQPAITCSKLTIETLEQDVKYVSS